VQSLLIFSSLFVHVWRVQWRVALFHRTTRQFVVEAPIGEMCSSQAWACSGTEWVSIILLYWTPLFTHTHTHIYIYIYIYFVCVYVCITVVVIYILNTPLGQLMLNYHVYSFKTPVRKMKVLILLCCENSYNLMRQFRRNII
jgi:hypothetical protein